MVRILCLIALLPALTGCMTSSVKLVGDVYYYYGPEAALEAADWVQPRTGELGLEELERAMALLELGRYRECLAALELARSHLNAGGMGELTTEDRPPWRPEYHEKVFVATLEMAAAMALQDAGQAAAAADRAVRAMDEAGCSPCSFNFTLVIAAVAYDNVGRFDDGLSALSRTVVIGRGDDMAGHLERRLERGVAGAEPEGLAPPPVENPRSAVVLLLLGRGPFKTASELAVSDSRTIPWPRYLPRDPPTATWAGLATETPVASVELTDVGALAVAALRERAERVVADRGAGVESDRRDLRHWASLPALMHLIIAEIPDESEQVDLVYYSLDGDEVYGETILWPDDWTGGRMYVVRRVP